jgi:hypothetical protein
MTFSLPGETTVSADKMFWTSNKPAQSTLYIMGISTIFWHGSTLQNFDLVKPTCMLWSVVSSSLRISVLFGHVLCGHIYNLVFSDVNVGVC